MLDVPPEHIRAIVVGIDVYRYGATWTLKGPAADAMRTVEWLLKLKVDPKHIALFLSPESWQAPEVVQWMQEHSWQVRRDAQVHVIADFIDSDLQGLGGKALLVHWGGHGAVDDQTRRNYMFTADAKSGTPRCLSAQDMLFTLSDAKFSHLSQQAFIFDMCAGAFSRVSSNVPPKPQELFRTTSANIKAQQCAMYSSSMGLLAANISKRGTGLFTELLFTQLKTYGRPTLAQFGEAFAAIKQNGHSNGLGTQKPRLQFKDPVDPEFEAVAALPTMAGYDMSELIRVRKPSHGLLKRIYLQSLPVLRRQAAGDVTDTWLRDLADARPRDDGYGAPLIEFAERLARASGDLAFSEWAKANAEPGPYALVAQKLDEEQVAQKPIATLFIEIDSATARRVQWWIEAPDPALRSHPSSAELGPRGLIEELEDCLSPILLEASGRTESAYRLRIGFIVPASLFSVGLESILINWDGDTFILNQQYPVLFHWYDRTVRKLHRYVMNWNTVLKTLAPRIQQGSGAPVHWLDQAAANDDSSRYARASDSLQASTNGAICLGIDHPYASTSDASLLTVVECLKHGVPCLFWLQLPSANKKQVKEIRERVTTAFARVDSCIAPVAVWHGRKIARLDEQILPIGVVWDVPEFLPHSISVQSRFEDSQ